jgi:hypothetical protein
MNASVQSAVAPESPVRPTPELRSIPITGEVSEVAKLAKQKLDMIIDAGRANAARVVERVLGSTPEDTLVRGNSLDVHTNGEALKLATTDSSWSLHSNAFGQICERIGLPLSFAKDLHSADAVDRGTVVRDNAWRRNLLETNFRELLRHGPERHLIRSISGEARAVLSDRYRRLDSRPLLDAFIGACGEFGAVPYEGLATELSAAVRAIVPTVFEPVTGEFLVLGLSWQNSDFGTRAYSMSAFTLRLVCLNGMVGANELKQVHLGGRLPDDISFSARTYELDTKTMVSATADVVRSALDTRVIERKLDVVRRAHSEEVDWTSAWRRVARDLGKAEQKTLRDTFEGQDVINLPPGKTTWRLSNALSWMAHQADSDERRLDLERLAGAVLPETR